MFLDGDTVILFGRERGRVRAAEAMLREIRHYEREVRRVREALDGGNRERASKLLAEGGVMSHMELLRRESLALAATIESIEAFVRGEQEARR